MRSTRPTDPFLGSSQALQLLRQQAVLAQQSGEPVLILGESGSGKSTLAAWLHETGPRRPHRFVEVPCSRQGGTDLETRLFGTVGGHWTPGRTSSPGWLQTARQGTVFLDEVGDMDLNLQRRLRDVLESGEFQRNGDVFKHHADFRTLAGGSRGSRALAERGRFGPGLLVRLAASHVLRLPPLRDRREDLPYLSETILDRLRDTLQSPHLHLTREALSALEAHAWPGNLREFRTCLEGAALKSVDGNIRPEHLAMEVQPAGASGNASGPLGQSRWERERQSIRAALDGAEELAFANVAAAPAPLASPPRMPPKSFSLRALLPRLRTG